MSRSFRSGPAPWSRARRALGLIAVLGLNLALQPCAMALGGNSDCPQCPPVGEQPAGVHSDRPHHAGHDSTADLRSHCGAGTVGCVSVDDYSHDGRGAPGKLKDAFNPVPAAMTSPEVIDVDHQRVVSRVRSRPSHDPDGSFRPLNVLHCVYLK